jgi:hypothetical protein
MNQLNSNLFKLEGDSSVLILFWREAILDFFLESFLKLEKNNYFFSIIVIFARIMNILEEKKN